MHALIEKTTIVADLTPITPDDRLVLPKGFVLDSKGLSYCKSESDVPVKIADPFMVRGLARDPKGHGWSVLLAWNDHDGKFHLEILPQAGLIGDGADVFRPLVSAGLRISPKATHIKMLKEFLLGLTCDMRVRLVKQAGWYGQAFVLPNRTIGDTAGEQVMFEGSADAARYATAGTMGDWKDKVARLCAGNTRAVFACSVACAGPLNDLLQGEGGGFHFVGSSSVGKTTLLTLAGSIFGGGGRMGFAHSWHGTENGIESIARAHSGAVLVLDEMGQADGRTIGSTVYMLINGTGRARATRNAELKSQASWRIMLLSSGELTLANKIAEGGRQPRAGQLARMVDIPADAGQGYGAFEDTKGIEPAAFSEALKNAALRTYGTAGPAFIEGLADDPGMVEIAARIRILEITGKLLEGIPSSDGQAHRVAARFALVAEAGELARKILDLPWAEGEAERAAFACFHAWRETRGGEGPGELVAAMDALRAITQSQGESRFRSLDPISSADWGTPVQHGVIRDLLGYRFIQDGELVWGFTATGWREVVGGVGQPSTVAKLLAENGVLVTGADPAHRLAKRIDDRPQNLFAVKASALEAWGA
jgi:putative DNA primase/helicase